MEPNVTMNPRGLFDRSTKGKVLPPASVEITRAQIRFFSEVLGETDPIHFDVSAARAAGYEDLVAPPTFFMPIEALADQERSRQGQPSLASLLRCDFSKLLHGDERYVYRGSIVAGECVAVSTKIADFFDKKGGLMEFVTLETTVSHASRGILLDVNRTLLHRLG